MLIIIMTLCATRTLLKLRTRVDDELAQKRSNEAHTNIIVKNNNGVKTKNDWNRQPSGK